MQPHAESKEQEQNHLDQEDHEQIGENKRKEQEEICDKNLEELKKKLYDHNIYHNKIC